MQFEMILVVHEKEKKGVIIWPELNWFKLNWFDRPFTAYFYFRSMNPQNNLQMCNCLTRNSFGIRSEKRMRNFVTWNRETAVLIWLQAFTLLSHIMFVFVVVSGRHHRRLARAQPRCEYPRYSEDRERERCWEETMDMRVNNENGSQVISIRTASRVVVFWKIHGRKLVSLLSIAESRKNTNISRWGWINSV